MAHIGVTHFLQAAQMGIQAANFQGIHAGATLTDDMMMVMTALLPFKHLTSCSQLDILDQAGFLKNFEIPIDAHQIHGFS